MRRLQCTSSFQDNEATINRFARSNVKFVTTPTLTRPLCVDVIFPLAPGCSDCVDKLSEKCRIPCYPFKPFANHASVSRRGVSLWTTLHTCLLALLAVSPQRKETIVVDAKWNLVFRYRNGEETRSWIYNGGEGIRGFRGPFSSPRCSVAATLASSPPRPCASSP